MYANQHHLALYSKNVLRLLCQDGVSSITDISAVTKVGILFAIVIAALTKDGILILLNDAKLKKNFFDIIKAFELLFYYWAWLKK